MPSYLSGYVQHKSLFVEVYVLSPEVRSVFVDGTGEPSIVFTEQQHMFGKTPATQLRQLESEKKRLLRPH